MYLNEINNFLYRIKADPKQRIARGNGGQYLDDFLWEFAKIVRDKTIDDCRGSLKKNKTTIRMETKNKLKIELNDELFNWIKEVKEKKENKLTSINDVIKECIQRVKNEPIKVKITDYEKDVHLLYLGLQSVGIMIDYKTADLVHSMLEVFNKKRGQMSILDSSEIQAKHSQKWELYFNNLKD